MSRIDEHKAVVRRAAETHNDRDRDGFLACYSDELLVNMGEGLEPLVVTPDQHWAAVLSWAERFEGFSESIQELIAEGDLVFVRSRYSGIHRGVWRDIEPTGRLVEWDAWQVLRFEDGVIAEERMLMDTMSMVETLAAWSAS